MTTDQIIPILEHAQTIWIVTMDKQGKVNSVVVSDNPIEIAMADMAEALEMVFENEITDEQAPQVLNTWLGVTQDNQLN